MSDEHTDQRGGILGPRGLRVFAYGDTADEMELYALDEARRFFGADLALEVVRDYRVFADDGTKCGKKYHAAIDVRERRG